MCSLDGEPPRPVWTWLTALLQLSHPLPSWSLEKGGCLGVMEVVAQAKNPISAPSLKAACRANVSLDDCVLCMLQCCRSEFANLFHTMTDMLNVFQSLHVSGIVNMSHASNMSLWRSSVAHVSLLFLDEHPEVRLPGYLELTRYSPALSLQLKSRPVRVVWCPVRVPLTPCGKNCSHQRSRCSACRPCKPLA
jgi:hypothetical protein